jgi:hypothetical protein
VELPLSLFTTLHDAMTEAWVKWADFGRWQRFFSYGTLGRDAYIGVERGLSDLQFVVRDAAMSFQPINVNGLLVEGEFCQMMGGNTTVQSECGKDSTFTVTLPQSVRERGNS